MSSVLSLSLVFSHMKSRRVSRASWLSYPSSQSVEETAVWYYDGDQGGDSFSVTDTIRDFEEDTDDEDSVVSPPRHSYLSASMPRLPKAEPQEYEDAPDGSFSSYLGTLPRATRKLFRSELNLYKSDNQLKQE